MVFIIGQTLRKYCGYIEYCSVCLKIDYTLRCLEYILFSIFTIKTPWALAALAPLDLFNCEDTDKCTPTITCIYLSSTPVYMGEVILEKVESLVALPTV